MIRQCVVSTTDVQAVQRSDGSWTVEGVEAEHFLDTVLIMERWAKPFNSSFHVTLNSNECIQRIIRNESDFSNFLIPIQTESPSFHAPVTVFPGKNQFITGYNTSDQLESGEERATVLTNVSLLRPDVYLWSVVLLLSLFSFIAIRVSIHYRALIRWRPVGMALGRVISREMSCVFYHSNDRFKLITMLYTVLCFYLVTSFLCIYKTSHVIAEKPFYPTSYLESLEHSSSLFGYYNQFVVVSKGFEEAPVTSLKGRLWKKLMASGLREQYQVDPESTSLATLPALMTRFTVAIVFDKCIAVASSITIPLLKSLACGFSPEGQLWFLKVFSDPSEKEVIYGYATAKQFSAANTLKKTLRRSFESHITSHHYRLATDVTHIAQKIAGTSKGHQWKQQLACDDEKALLPDVEVHAIPLAYFHSFFLACIIIWIAAFIINLIQIASYKSTPRRRRRTQ